MIIVCQKCSTRLQIDEEKSPNRPFNIRCPRCNATVNPVLANPASEQGALAVGGSPSTQHPRFERPTARAYEHAPTPPPSETSSADEAVRLLIELLSKGTRLGIENSGVRSPWARRKALVCTAEAYREKVARRLSENDYQVYVAEDARQAIETMRANLLEVVIVEQQFDGAEQGAALVIREVNILRPAQRRRLFFVLLAPSLRTMDAHAAFLSNVNAVVNINDIEELPRILEVALREFNDLYKEFNSAFHLTAL